MNNCTLTGMLDFISDAKTFSSDGEKYRYRVVNFKLVNEDGKVDKKLFVSCNLWEEVALPPIGSIVDFTFKINSAPNRKDPSIFFHKVNLVSVRPVL